MSDASNCGACQRDDFINAVFDTVRGLKPAEMMKLLQTFASQYDDLVNYEDFLTLADRQGVTQGGLDGQSQRTNHLGGRTSERSMRNVIERVKHSIVQARGGMQAFEATMRKLGGSGGLTISQEDMLIALSRVNAQLTLDDIREFFNAINGNQYGGAEDQTV